VTARIKLPPEQAARMDTARRLLCLAMGRKAAHEARQRAEARALNQHNTATTTAQSYQKKGRVSD